MDPAVFGKAIKSHYPLPVSAQRLNRLGVQLAIAGIEMVAQLLAFGAVSA